MIARLLRARRTLLVLDGLEPLQHPPGAQTGRLKDPAVQALVKELAALNPGLCVISTRLAVADVAGRAGAVAVDLDRLPPTAGADLLRRLGVEGSDDELRAASQEFGGHGLALSLLGTYLRDICGGDVRRRREVPLLDPEIEQGGHARRVMRSYETWLGEGPELRVLRMIGLFDRPADAAALEALRREPPIPGLTVGLTANDETRWRKAVARLRQARLLARDDATGGLDAHPLVREHFGERLRREQPEAFERLKQRAKLAVALHQAGRWKESVVAFREAEALQTEWQPQHPWLFSIGGYWYCDLLLAMAEPEDGPGLDEIGEGRKPESERYHKACEVVRERASQTIKHAQEGWYSLLDIALDQLNLGRAHLGVALTSPAGFAEATEYLDRAVVGLRQAAQDQELPRGLLARAALRRLRGTRAGGDVTADLEAAAADLREVLEIAERGHMRLHEADAHLEWTRLRLQTGDRDAARRHLEQARELVTACGYGRRQREVTWLSSVLDDEPAARLPASMTTDDAEVASSPREDPMKDFFISYNSADRDWAEWIAWTLEEAGYSVVIHAWDFQPGGDFILEMHQAATATEKTVIVLSGAYLGAEYTQPEWSAAFARDPRGDNRALIPLRVEECSPGGLLRTRIYADLAGLAPDDAKAVLLAALQDRAKPKRPPAFPGRSPRRSVRGGARRTAPGAYPGTPVATSGNKAVALWREKLEFLREQEAIAVAADQKFALMKQIEEAERKLRELGG